MPYDNAYCEITKLSEELDHLDDPRQGVVRVQQRMKQYREAGLKVPDQLLRMERQLKIDCVLQSQGR